MSSVPDRLLEEGQSPVARSPSFGRRAVNHPSTGGAFTGNLQRTSSAVSDDIGGERPGTPASQPYSLHVALAQGRIALARRLIRDGCDINEREEKEGWTPLHIAAGLGHEDGVELLLAEGAQPDEMDNSGWTPLHSACRLGHTGACLALIQGGADPMARARVSGKIPIEYALENDHMECARAVREAMGMNKK